MTNAGDKRLDFDALKREFPAHYSVRATDFRRHSVGFAATIRGGSGVLWIGPAGLEFAETPVADGRQIAWDEVATVEMPGAGEAAARPSAGSVFLLGAWSLMLEPSDPEVYVDVTKTDGSTIGATVFGSSTSEVRTLVSTFRAGYAASAAVASSTVAVGELERLASLHDAGKLTNDEFAAAKGKFLGL